MIEVRPTGVYGEGKVRLYPTPRPEAENAWGYATRLAFTDNPDTGQRYVPLGIIPSFRFAEPIGNFAEIVDRWLLPEDYWDQAELDRRKRINDDAAHGIPGGTGPYPVSALSTADCQFVNWISAFKPKYKDAWLKLIAGDWHDITQAMQRGQGSFDPYSYDGPLQNITLEVYGPDQGD